MLKSGLIMVISQKGTWEEVFGKGIEYGGVEWKTNFPYYTEEIFMAWNYARYVGEIAKKGKAAVSTSNVCQCLA